MRTLSILLLVASPLLAAVGTVGCLASLVATGDSSRQMMSLGLFGLIGSPLLFVSGSAALVEYWRKRRLRQDAEELREGRDRESLNAVARIAGATAAIASAATIAAFAALGLGVISLALNLFFLAMTADAWLASIQSGGAARYVVVALVAAIGCLPVGYAMLTWQSSFGRRVGEALRPYEDALMKAMESAAMDYLNSRPADAPHAAAFAASIRRVSGLPEPVKQLLAWVARRTKLAAAMDLAVGASPLAEADVQAVIPLAVAGIRRALDKALFAPRPHFLPCLFLLNLCLCGLMIGVTTDFATAATPITTAVILVGIILLSNHPVAQDVRNMLLSSIRQVIVAVGCIACFVAGATLIGKSRSQGVRWIGFAILEILYALVILFVGVVLCVEFGGDFVGVIVLLAGAAFVFPSLGLMGWIRATCDSTPQPSQEPTSAATRAAVGSR